MLLEENLKTIQENLGLIPVVLLPSGMILCSGVLGKDRPDDREALLLEIALAMGHHIENLPHGTITAVDANEMDDLGRAVYCRFTSHSGLTFIVMAEGKDFLWIC